MEARDARRAVAARRRAACTGRCAGRPTAATVSTSRRSSGCPSTVACSTAYACTFDRARLLQTLLVDAPDPFPQTGLIFGSPSKLRIASSSVFARQPRRLAFASLIEDGWCSGEIEEEKPDCHLERRETAETEASSDLPTPRSGRAPDRRSQAVAAGFATASSCLSSCLWRSGSEPPGAARRV